MATSFRQFGLRLCNRAHRKTKFPNFAKQFSVTRKRFLLSEAYSCNEAWKEHLQDPNLKQVSLSEFGYQIRDQLEQSGYVSAVDMNVLVHQLHNIDDDEADFMEDLLVRFNMCQGSIPRSDSTSHAIVRGFLAKTKDGSARLVRLLSQPMHYGLLPHHYSLSLLCDNLIESGNFAGAAQVAYHSMLQEDMDSHPVNVLLCLNAAIHRLLQGPVSELALPAPEKDEDEQEDWIKVKYIRYPVYDDHFDIKDERFLLGKTLHKLGQVQSVIIPEHIRTSLDIVGCGIHHKFNQGLTVIRQILASSTGLIPQQALDYFSQSLENVEARDPEEPEVEIALRTVDDVIHRLLPTTLEKQEFQTLFGQYQEQLSSQGRIKKDFDLGSSVSEFVKAELPKFEKPDIENQLKLFSLWQEERKAELIEQMEKIKKNQRIEEIKKQVKELQEQEELLSYFDFEEKIRLTLLDDDLAKDENLTISK